MEELKRKGWCERKLDFGGGLGMKIVVKSLGEKSLNYSTFAIYRQGQK
jgi:hypothetical protein